MQCLFHNISQQFLSLSQHVKSSVDGLGGQLIYVCVENYKKILIMYLLKVLLNFPRNFRKTIQEGVHPITDQPSLSGITEFHAKSRVLHIFISFGRFVNRSIIQIPTRNSVYNDYYTIRVTLYYPVYWITSGYINYASTHAEHTYNRYPNLTIKPLLVVITGTK